MREAKEIKEEGEVEVDLLEIEEKESSNSIRLKSNASNVKKREIFYMNVLSGRRKRIMLK